MEEKIMRLTFASSLTKLCEVNSSFDSAVLRIAYHDLNRNKSFISKDVFERCAHTMHNCPVVCNYDRDTDTIGGHDIDVFKDNDGNLRVVNATTPVGVVPSQAQYWWDTFTEEDGTEHEYLYTEVLLWKRQEEYEKLKKDGITSHSMELKIKDGEMIDGVYYIYDFEFNAFCLIGVEPCFESSALTFSHEEFDKKFSEMMQDLKETIKQVNTSKDVDDTHPQKYSMEGGNEVLDKKIELAAKYGIDIESLDFSLDDFTLEELTEKFEAMTKTEDENVEENATFENVSEDEAESDEENVEADTFALTSAIQEELCRMLSEYKIDREWGQSNLYCYVDSDLEAKEVYCWDTSDWKLYGFNFAIDGDAVSIDMESKKRKKFTIVDFEGEQDSPIAPVFTAMEKVIQDNAGWKAKYNTASEQITSMETELASLKEFKRNADNESKKASREELFSKFADLSGIEAYEALLADCISQEEAGELKYDIDSLTKELFSIRGMNCMPLNFSLEENRTAKIKVDKSNTFDSPYGGIVEHYLNLGN